MVTTPRNVDSGRYDTATIWLHWTTVGLIVILWTIGQTADWLPRGPARSGLWSMHVLLGFVTGFVLVTRVAWRARFGRILPPANTGVLYTLAKVTHHALYVLLGVVIIIGIVDASYRGFNLFGLWPLPQFGAGDAATRHSINEWHEFTANSLIFLALAHAMTALAHHYVWRDQLLNRMKP